MKYWSAKGYPTLYATDENTILARLRQIKTPDEIALLRRLSRMSPYIAVIVLPGGFAMLPALAWWLDRRRVRRGMIGGQT